MRYSLFVLLLLPLCLFGQYPTTGVKQRLGYQTTGDGLIYRGNGSPSFTPTGIMNAWTYIDTTAGTMYNYFAGSWHELETGGGVTMPLDSVEFNTAYTSQFGTGVMAYDPDNETVSVGIDGGATLQLGQELYYPLVINKSGALIKNGTPVMVDTATLTTGDHVRILPAKNNGIIPSNYIMGVATTDIENDSTGLVTWFGYVREVKESDIAQSGVTLSIGNILYISATEAGKYTNVAPSTPYHRSTIALVARRPNSNNLTLLVRPWLAPRLADLSDVNTSSVTGLSVLRYNSSAGTWDASATAGIVAADTAAMLVPYVNVADTAAMLNAYPLGSATSGQVAYWDGSRSLTGSSGLTWNESSKYLKVTNGSYYGILKGYNTGVVAITGESNGAYGWGFSNTTISNLYGNDIRFSSNIKIGSVNQAASYALHIESSNAIKIPVGTTAQRPTGASGVLRFNSDSTKLEFHNGTAWSGLQSTITNPVTGTGASGQVAYWSGTGTQTGNNNLFYDAINARLGVGTNTPGGKVTAYSNVNGRGVIENWNINTGSDTYASFANYVGNSSTGDSNFRLSSLIAFPKNYTSSTWGGSYAAGGTTLWMYGGIDTTNNHITHAITNVYGGSETNYNPSFRWVKATTNNYTIANELMRLNKTGLGIKQNTPLYSIDINATDGIRIPSGTTAQRPTGASGVLRFNSDSTGLEYHNGTSWRGIVNTWDAGTGGGGGSSVWSETADTVYLPSGKYVGIGTASPDQKLHVDGGVKSSRIILDSGVDTLQFSNYAPTGSIGGNLILGNGLLSSTSAAFGNIAIGLDALKNNTSGVVNTAIGANTLTNNTTGQQNLAIGAGNLYKNTTGRNNIAIGTNTAYLSANPMTGSNNTFIGGATGRTMESGYFNVFIGQSAGQDFISGTANIAIGPFAYAYPSTTGNYSNIAIGPYSLGYVAGNSNVAIGDYAGTRINSGANLTSASGSIFIGNDTRASALANSNEIVIGGLARGQGSNTIMLGNSSISSLYCYDTSISSPSDERDKTDIDSLTIGLEFLKKLNPVAFTWNARDGGKVGQKDVGFIAQQAMPAQAAEAQGLNLNLVEYKESTDQYFMQYSNLIPVLVKAIKEQQAQIDALKIEIENLKNK